MCMVFFTKTCQRRFCLNRTWAVQVTLWGNRGVCSINLVLCRCCHGVVNLPVGGRASVARSEFLSIFCREKEGAVDERVFKSSCSVFEEAKNR